MNRAASELRSRGRLRQVTRSTLWVDMVVLTEPGRLFIIDPAGLAPAAVRPLLQADDRGWGDNYFLEVCTPDNQRLEAVVTDTLQTRTWHREADTEPWQPRSSAWKHLGPVVTTSISDTQLLFGAPGDIHHLIVALEATNEFTFGADRNETLTHTWIGTSDPLMHARMTTQLLAVGRAAGVLIAPVRPCRLPRL